MPDYRILIRKGLEYLAFSLSVMAAALMAAIVGLITYSVAMRKLANMPLHITEELVGLMLSVSLFLCLPLITLKSSHIKVTLVLDYAGERMRKPLQVLALVVGTVFFSWITYDAIHWFEFAYRLNLKTEAARLLLYPWMLAVPATTGLSGLIFMLRLFGLLQQTSTEPASTLAGAEG